MIDQKPAQEPPFSARCRDMGADGSAVDAMVTAVRHDLSQRHRYGLPDPGFGLQNPPFRFGEIALLKPASKKQP